MEDVMSNTHLKSVTRTVRSLTAELQMTGYCQATARASPILNKVYDVRVFDIDGLTV